ncbi:hypothetical protein BSKO_12643 [Bryopsis sp. KO-2023]|nr:hypothetical protein BSKO_12643 [Bryopsis sp. KO-2023]
MDEFKNENCPWWGDLDSNGYCVIDGVVSRKDCRRLRDGIVDCFDTAGWRNARGKWDLPRNCHGIFQGFGVGHLLEVWEARKLCKKVFQSLWDTEQLLCSFDGMSFVPEGKNWKDVDATWYHIDQGVEKRGLRCIQGLLTLNDMRRTDATFSVVPGTHRLHDDFSETFKHADLAAQRDFLRMGTPKHDPLKTWKFYTAKGCAPVRVSAKAGSMVLWDSRCVHCNVPPVSTPGQRERMVVYVCMLPKSECSAHELARKAAHFNAGTMTSHWPYPVTAFCDQVRNADDWARNIPVKFEHLKRDEQVCSLAGLL